MAGERGGGKEEKEDCVSLAKGGRHETPASASMFSTTRKSFFRPTREVYHLWRTSRACNDASSDVGT